MNDTNMKWHEVHNWLEDNLECEIQVATNLGLLSGILFKGPRIRGNSSHPRQYSSPYAEFATLHRMTVGGAVLCL